MVSMKAQVDKLLKDTEITINGGNKWDPQVHNPKFFSRVISQGSLGLGESYMDGWWECDKLDEFFYKVLKENLEKKVRANIPMLLTYLKARIINLQSRKRAFQVIERHYDIGNDLYKAMLDKRLSYTCGYWKNANTLDKAQEAKLDLVCKKLNLKKGDKVLDIGCGWGSFLKYAAEKYGIKGVGITISKEQVDLARKLCKGLDVEIRLQDYRDVREQFDHIVTIGMFEAVGVKNYREFMKIIHRNLKPEGLFLLHTIGNNKSVRSYDPWMDKYIFPNGMLPSIKQLGESIENLFVMEDWHNFGADYDKTLIAWHKNFEKNWGKLKNKYGERFYRMWKYYLLTCAGLFRARKMQVWQIVLSKQGVQNGYKSIR